MTDIRALLQMGQQMQGRLAAMQTELAGRTVTGQAGGGMVTITADGRGQVRSVKVDPSLLASDVEMLEDLVLAALTEVQTKAADIAQEEAKKLQSALPFPLPFTL
jgi:DNA-binding YbaB/EbfC family protein